MFNLKNKELKEKGYTLIEILVGLVILSLLFTVGYINFRDFSRREAVAGAGKILQGDIRLAQQLALSGQKPNDPKCNAPNTLIGYYFSVFSTTEYRIQANCSGGMATALTKDVFLPAGITVAAAPASPILFKVLGQGTNIPDGTSVVITVSQTGSGNKFTVTVDSGGNVQ